MFNYSIIKKERFDKVWAQIKAAGLGEDIYPEEAKLRMALPIVDGQGQYIFNLTKESLADNLSTFVLQDNDVFVPSAIGVLIGLTETATGVQHLFSFAPKNDDVHPSVFKAGFTTDTIDALYAGHLQWKLGTNVVLNQYPMENFKKVYRQQGAFVLNSNDEPVQEGIQPEWCIENMLNLLMPKYTIAGNQDHFVSVNFDAGVKQFPVTSGYTAQLVLYMDGFLVKGGATRINGKNAFGDAPARF